MIIAFILRRKVLTGGKRFFDRGKRADCCKKGKKEQSDFVKIRLLFAVRLFWCYGMVFVAGSFIWFRSQDHEPAVAGIVVSGIPVVSVVSSEGYLMSRHLCFASSAEMFPVNSS